MDPELIRAHQEEFLAREKARDFPSYVDVGGFEIVVNPGVFPPATDTKLLAWHINVSVGERTLDLTAGSGAFSVIAGSMGATGVAGDINPEAVKNAQENFDRQEVEMTAVLSDLYENIPKEKFDQVFANGPFVEGEVIDLMDNACYGAQSFITKLFAGLRDYMKPEGKLLIVLSEWSDLDFFNNTANANGFSSNQIDSRKSTDGQRNYLLYEVRQ